VVVEVVGGEAAEEVAFVTFPARSTAAQNELDGHDTELNDSFGSTLLALDHECPLKTTTFPKLSTAAQNEEVGHEIDSSWELLISRPFDQESPLKVKTLPLPSTASHEADDEHETKPPDPEESTD
jgi:hypothetical protein